MEEAMGVDASPFEPEYETDVKKTFICRGGDFQELITYPSSPSKYLGSFEWAAIPFELSLEKLADVTDENHKDLIMHVNVHRDSPDPHWRCSFVASARTMMDDDHICYRNWKDCTEWEETASIACNADKQNKSFIVPLMRLSDSAKRANGIVVELTIKILSWSGVFPTAILSFARKTNVSDATLIVDGVPLYVTRAILAMRSKFFHELFYNRSFPDHASDEFELKDVEFGHMYTFLRLIYPSDSPEKPIRIDNLASLEAMLELADRWDCPYVSKQMERFLLEERLLDNSEGCTRARFLYFADKYRLSAACSALIKRIGKDAEQLKQFGKTPEYKEISDGLCRALLDTVVESEEPGGVGWEADEEVFSITHSRKRPHQPAASVSASSAQVVQRPAPVYPHSYVDLSSSSSSPIFSPDPISLLSTSPKRARTSTPSPNPFFL